eukprot:TRINITY_DN21596_c0_g1_i2.p1 TRINITY_DN21596_c0_g1~~TRINITY_DN21596_c0_g1_i2.p1  ORF type:complete len:115 (+),score=30.98 TRINITY_DN21596_c0_g1_i2:58-402(+)
MERFLEEIRARNERMEGRGQPYFPAYDPRDQSVWRDPRAEPRGGPAVVEVLDTSNIESLEEDDAEGPTPIRWTSPPSPSPPPGQQRRVPRHNVTKTDEKILRYIATQVVRHKVK